MTLKKEVFKFLKSYSSDPFRINRLVVSAFLYSNGVKSVRNKHIKSLLISKRSKEFVALEKFLEIQLIPSFDDLIKIFEFVISPAEKKVTGAIYTPKFIRDYIVENVLNRYEDVTEIRACDPACGCSGFLFSLAKEIKAKSSLSYFEIFKGNIYGCDIQPYSVERSKILLSLLAIIENNDEPEYTLNLYTGNALSFNWSNSIAQFEGFDIVIGNPPYVSSRHIDSETMQILSNWKVCSTGHPDLYIPFFQLGIELLKENGYLSFITMNTFFKSVNGKALRQYFQEERFLIDIIDFGGIQIFNSKSTYTCICTIRKRRVEYLNYVKVDSLENFNELVPEKIPYSILDAASGWNLQNIELLNRIQQVGVPLGKKFKSRNGIATLKNSVYIFDILREDEQYYYLEREEVYAIEKLFCKDIINPNKLINVNSIEEIKQKIIFPYEFEGNQIFLMKEEKVKANYPFAYLYLLSQKDELATRDKGNGKYENWYAYGRNQSLDKFKFKLFFPHISNKIPQYVLNKDEDLLFYNGLALLADNERDLLFLSKLLSTNLFWFYIVNSSRHYGSDYFSISKNYFKNFGVYNFDAKEKDYIIQESNYDALNRFIEEKYDIKLEKGEIISNQIVESSPLD